MVDWSYIQSVITTNTPNAALDRLREIDRSLADEVAGLSEFRRRLGERISNLTALVGDAVAQPAAGDGEVAPEPNSVGEIVKSDPAVSKVMPRDIESVILDVLAHAGEPIGMYDLAAQVWPEVEHLKRYQAVRRVAIEGTPRKPSLAARGLILVDRRIRPMMVSLPSAT